jgi:nitroreductase
MLMLSVARLTFAENGKPNRHAYHDVGLAVAQLVLQATAIGLVAHQMAGFSVEKARETYRIPDGHDPIAAIAIGYQGDPATLSDRLRERELGRRSRKPLEAFAFAGEWGRPFFSGSRS